jgi:hypothetical protein
LRELKLCFDDLDEDNSGSIGVNEMKVPLIGLGFANTIEDVTKMVAAVDDDNTGAIEFSEFLKIIKGTGGSNAGNTRKMTEFFKKLTSGELGDRNVSFLTFVNT